MGMGPKTKAECDAAILNKQKRVTYATEYYEQMKANYGSSSSAAKNAKVSLATEKAELAELKALRKTLK